MFFAATDSKLKSVLSGVDPAIGWRRVSGDKSGVKLNISPPPPKKKNYFELVYLCV